MRATVGSSQCGSVSPSRLQASPVLVAMMSGLRTSAAPNPRPLLRAMGQTAATLAKGTQKPINTAIDNKPSAPPKRSASAKPINELKRKPTCAAAACSRR